MIFKEMEKKLKFTAMLHSIKAKIVSKTPIEFLEEAISLVLKVLLEELILTSFQFMLTMSSYYLHACICYPRLTLASRIIKLGSERDI